MRHEFEDRISRSRDAGRVVADAMAAALPRHDVTSLELAALLHGVTQRLDRFDRRMFGMLDMQRAEYMVLSLLATTAGPAGITPSELQESLQQTSGGMTRCLDRLERKGLVRRRVNTEDRRSVRIVLTPKGTTRARRLMEERVAALDALLEPIGNERCAELRDQLHTLVAALDLALEA